MDLTGKTILVTGAGRGIGKVIASRFATHGANVSIVARNNCELEQTASEIRVAGGNVISIAGDVSKIDQVRMILNRTLDSFHHIDILINAAAVQPPIGPLWQNDPDFWENAIRVNLLGNFFLCHEVIPRMIDRKQGVIILFSGGGAVYARPNFSAYGVSKTAVVRMVETLSLELEGTGVLIYAIAPGAVRTKMTEEILKAGANAGDKAFEEAQLVMQAGGMSPEKAADLCLYLASEKPGSLAGRLIHVNEPYKEYAKMVDLSEAGFLRRMPFGYEK